MASGISLTVLSLLSAVFLSSRVGAFVYDCPDGWVTFSDRCYHFVLYPKLPYSEASQACHQNGSSLISIESTDENNFIVRWLSHYDGISFNQWYTSGVEIHGNRKWEGTGQEMVAEDAYWVVDPDAHRRPSSWLTETHLVYQYVGGSKKRFGWAWTSRSPALAYICEIQRDEVYRILQQDRDFSYGTESRNPNDWRFGPKFQFVSPSIIFTSDTERFNIDCFAEGNPPPSYKWYKSYGTANQALVQATDRYTVTNGRLTISDPNQVQDSGTYTCVAENPSGSIFTRPIVASQGFLREFSNDKPGTRTAVLYKGAVIDCSPPSHNPGIMVQWMKGKMFIRPEMNKHTFLSENGKLYFSEIQAADAAEYTCIVVLASSPGTELVSQQENSGVSLGIPLVIDGENANDFGPDIHNDFPAVFPNQPLKGQEVHLECLAYGRLPLTYSWSRVDGGAMPEGRLSNRSLNRVLIISDVRLEDSGTYMCSVKGPKNTDMRNITLDIAAKPYFKFPLRDQHLDVGSRLTWVCDAVAIPAASYSWYRNGKLLKSDPSINLQVDDNVLTITGATAEQHNGMYECLAKNDHGTGVSIAQIRVLSFIPTFEVAPVDKSLMGGLGGNLTIRCRPQGAPQPTITWTHNGSPVGGPSGRATILQSGDLVLTGLSQGDEGLYTCQAENSLGSAKSSGRLKVLRRTVLTSTPHNAPPVTQNSTAHLPCQASFAVNSTDLVYRWLFNNWPLDLENDPSYHIAEKSGVQGLYVIGAQFKHQGWYECRATTVYDSVNAQGYLAVRGPPDEPAGVHVHSRRGTEVTIWWQPGLTHGEIITLYRIQFHSNHDSTWRTLVDDIPVYMTQISEYPAWRQYLVKENLLAPGTQYSFRVFAASANFGYGQPSVPSAMIKLDDAAPIHALETVTGGGGSVGMLKVKWLPLPPERHGGVGLYYLVHWRKHRNPDDMWRTSPHVLGNRPDREGYIYFHHKVGEVNFYTAYDVKVQAVNAKGPGPNSTIEQIMSAEDIPVSTPQNVVVEGLNATAGLVTWELPNNTRESLRGKVMGYQMNWYHWQEERNRQIIRFKRVYGPEKSGIIIGLNANDDYWVDVQVFNSAGLSRPSGHAYMNTNYLPPQHYPDFVLVTSNGPDSVRVSWRGVSTVQTEAPVQGYKIWYWPYTDNIRTAKVAQFGKVFSGVVHGIEKNKIYKMRVLGYSTGGDGKKTPATYFTLGGQIRFNPQTSEVMASASVLKPSAILFTCLSVITLYSMS